MLEQGIVGLFEPVGECEECCEACDCGVPERCVIWFVDSEVDLNVLESEIKWFTSKFLLRGFQVDGVLEYQFGDKGRAHKLVVGEECFCFTFSTGRLTRVPVLDVYKGFVRAI